MAKMFGQGFESPQLHLKKACKFLQAFLLAKSTDKFVHLWQMIFI